MPVCHVCTSAGFERKPVHGSRSGFVEFLFFSVQTFLRRVSGRGFLLMASERVLLAFSPRGVRELGPARGAPSAVVTFCRKGPRFYRFE